MSNKKEYMKKYMKERYHRRKSAAIKKLGGRCVTCNSENNLEIDHVNPDEKSFVLAKALSGWSESRVQEELEKCQLLCVDCHKKKTRKELSIRFNQREYWEHGTLSGVRYCRCELCLNAKKEYMKEYSKKYKKKKVTPP